MSDQTPHPAALRAACAYIMAKPPEKGWAHDEQEIKNLAEIISAKYRETDAALPAVIASLEEWLPRCGEIKDRHSDSDEICNELATHWGSFGCKYCDRHKSESNRVMPEAVTAIAALAIARAALAGLEGKP